MGLIWWFTVRIAYDRALILVVGCGGGGVGGEPSYAGSRIVFS